MFLSYSIYFVFLYFLHNDHQPKNCLFSSPPLSSKIFASENSKNDVLNVSSIRQMLLFFPSFTPNIQKQLLKDFDSVRPPFSSHKNIQMRLSFVSAFPPEQYAKNKEELKHSNSFLQHFINRILFSPFFCRHWPRKME